MHSYGAPPFGLPASISLVAIMVIVLFALAMAVLMTVAWCMIFKRAGYSWALGLLSLVPIANLIIIFVLAFSRWPVQNELDQYKTIVGAQNVYPRYGVPSYGSPPYGTAPPPGAGA